MDQFDLNLTSFKLSYALCTILPILLTFLRVEYNTFSKGIWLFQKTREIEYTPSDNQFDLNVTSFKLSYASQAPSGPARLRWEHLKNERPDSRFYLVQIRI